LVNEISLYYDARSKEHQRFSVVFDRTYKHSYSYLCCLFNIFKQRKVFALFSVNLKTKKAATIAECLTRAILHITNIMDTSDKKICVLVVFTYPHITSNTYEHNTRYSVSAPTTLLPNPLPLHSRHPTHYCTKHNACLIRLVIQHVTQNDDLSYFCDKTTFTVYFYIWIFI
jgi:hypothetical protein